MKNMKRILLLSISLLALLFFLAACGGGESEEATTEPTTSEEAAPEAEEATTAPEPTDTPVPPTNTPEPEPTAEPTEEPTPEPEPEADFEEITVAQSGLTLSYPAGWFTAVDEASGELTLASNEALLDDTSDLEADDLAILGLNLPNDGLAFLLDDGEDVNDPLVVLNAFSALFTESASAEGDTEFTVREEASTSAVAGYDAATAVYDIFSDDQEGITKLVAISDPDNNRTVFIIGATLVESVDENLALFDSILDTIQLSEPTVTGLGDGGSETTPPTTTDILLYGDVVQGTVADEMGESWSFIGLEGEAIDIIIEPVGELDVVVNVVDAEGNSIIGGELDDDFGTESIFGLEIPASGEYFIQVRGFVGGTGDYELTITEAGAAGGTETAVGEGDIVAGETMAGSVTSSEPALITFNASADDFLDIIVTPLTEDFDIVVDVLDANGISLNENPTDASYDTEYVPVVIIPEDGVYSVEVSGFDGATGDFEVTIVPSNNGQTNTIFFAASSLDDAEETHIFPLTGNSGDSVTAIVEPLELEFDVVVGIYDDDTDELIEEVDASTGIEYLTFVLSADGNFYFQVSGYEGSTGNYDIALIGPATVIYELAVGDEVYGEFDESNLIEYFLGGEAGEVVTINLEPGADTDVALRILDLDGNELVALDDGFEGESEVLEYTFESEDLIIIEITDFYESEGDFSMTIE